MPALNFTLESKIAWILERTEGQTIRPPRKHPIKPGDKLYLYAGMRTKNCRKLGEAACSGVVPITLRYLPTSQKRIYIYGEIARYISYSAFARLDGFNNYSDFEQFFIQTYKLKPGDSLDMVIIKWKEFRAYKPLGEKKQKAICPHQGDCDLGMCDRCDCFNCQDDCAGCVEEEGEEKVF